MVKIKIHVFQYIFILSDFYLIWVKLIDNNKIFEKVIKAKKHNYIP